MNIIYHVLKEKRGGSNYNAIKKTELCHSKKNKYT